MASGEAMVGLPTINGHQDDLVRKHGRLSCRDVDLRNPSVKWLRQVLGSYGAFRVKHARVCPPGTLYYPDNSGTGGRLTAAAGGRAALLRVRSHLRGHAHGTKPLGLHQLVILPFVFSDFAAACHCRRVARAMPPSLNTSPLPFRARKEPHHYCVPVESPIHRHPSFNTQLCQCAASSALATLPRCPKRLHSDSATAWVVSIDT
mmetsp:Transcript_19688/g.59719  ORF Transcript_19688/g.59719 Transcript_19688/m.59719 type:complete len:204 (+) Transcript_19688:1974-2585(+)